MAIWDKIKAELIDIIDWTDESPDTMVWRFSRYQNEIKYGAKLTVRESQVAVFVNEGQIADVFNPGMYSLETKNLPVLTTLKKWYHGFNSPFKAEVYFINTKNFTDMKWGTKNPVMLRDPEFGPVRLKGFGSYVLRVSDAVTFIKEIVGTDAHFTTGEINNQLRNIIVSRFADHIGECQIPALDLAAKYDELSDQLSTKISPEFSSYGLEITKLLIENISLPEEVEQAIDKRTSMGVIGNLDNYTKFQTANAMEEAAKNPGGDASAGIGMGMGFAMANQMGKSLSVSGEPAAPAASPQTESPPPLPQDQSVQYYIGIGGEQKGPFSEKIVAHMIADCTIEKGTLVWCKGMNDWSKAEEVENLKSYFENVPPPMPK